MARSFLLQFAHPFRCRVHVLLQKIIFMQGGRERRLDFADFDLLAVELGGILFIRLGVKDALLQFSEARENVLKLLVVLVFRQARACSCSVSRS